MLFCLNENKIVDLTFNNTEHQSYEASLKTFRDNKATFDYAKEEAYSEGKLEGN